MRGPLKELTSYFLIRLSPLVLVPIGLFRRTQHPLLYDFMGLKILSFIFHRTQSPRLYPSQDSKSSFLSFIGLKVLAFNFHRTQSSPLSFIGLKVLAFIFHRTQSPLSLCFHRTQSPLSFTFKRLQCLYQFTLSKDYNVFIYISKTSMSSVIYAFKRLQYLHLRFKDFNVFSHLRFQGLQCLHLHLQDFNDFCLLHFTRLQCLLSFTLYKTSTSYVFYRTQCPCLCTS